jgi:hypothetical protein
MNKLIRFLEFQTQQIMCLNKFTTKVGLHTIEKHTLSIFLY